MSDNTRADIRDTSFAHLIPHNTLAIQAFSEVCDALQRQPQQFDHHAQFIVRHGDATTALLPSARGDFNRASKLPKIGWRAGYGRAWHASKTGNVDLLLATTKYGKLRGNHAVFSFTKDGILTVAARHMDPGVQVGTDLVTASDLPRALTGRREYLIILGDLVYKFKYVVPQNRAEDAQRRTDLAEYFKNVLELPSPHEMVSATPSERDMIISNWTVHSIVGIGGQATIRAASWHRGGKTAGLKLMTRVEANGLVDQEVSAYRRMKRDLNGIKHKQYVMQIEDLIYEHGGERFTRRGDIYMFWTPLARGDFSSLILNRPAESSSPPLQREQLLTLFSQVLQGLCALHTAGWLHRDIKPQNLGIVSLDPPTAVVLDLGQALCVHEDPLHGLPAVPGTCGTIGYLAPELETVPGSYGQPVDVWALACVGLELFSGGLPWKRRFNPWRRVEADDRGFEKQQAVAAFDNCHRRLAAAAGDSLEALLASMLELSAEKRVSLSSAVTHNALTCTEELDIEPRTGDKRHFAES
ncbi:Serine/threonine protein kinase [Elasticomyces elasticus]|nr:Serine/threonine protein kinase [Elasticomyces elasticus]